MVEFLILPVFLWAHFTSLFVRTIMDITAGHRMYVNVHLFNTKAEDYTDYILTDSNILAWRCALMHIHNVNHSYGIKWSDGKYKTPTVFTLYIINLIQWYLVDLSFQLSSVVIAIHQCVCNYCFYKELMSANKEIHAIMRCSKNNHEITCNS